jgi:hypothetical protein
MLPEPLKDIYFFSPIVPILVREYLVEKGQNLIPRFVYNFALLQNTVFWVVFP